MKTLIAATLGTIALSLVPNPAGAASSPVASSSTCKATSGMKVYRNGHLIHVGLGVVCSKTNKKYPVNPGFTFSSAR